jgi:type IV pilus assembly protein PilA
MKRKGFTLIELMVVILIVAILAAVLVPMMRGRIDAAKWSEANASCAQIRTALRAYIAEKGPNFTFPALTGGQGVWGPIVGITVDDLSGRYFLSGAYNVTNVVTDGTSADFGRCAITVTAASGPGPGGAPTNPAAMTMALDGTWQ